MCPFKFIFKFVYVKKKYFLVCVFFDHVAPPSGSTDFSSCSSQDFESLIIRGGGACLRNQPSPSDLIGVPGCGNGWLDEGEQCDCGPPEVQPHSATHSSARPWIKRIKRWRMADFSSLHPFHVSTGMRQQVLRCCHLHVYKRLGLC